MAENSNISWCDHTFNGWIGCARISPACDGCYAAALMGTDGRFGPARVQWGGPGRGEGTRDRTASSTWRLPHKWNRKAADAPGKTFVFCSSLADVFDNHPDVGPWRRDLFELIRATPNLTWLLLTKRPQNIVKAFSATISLEQYYEEGPPSVHWPSNILLGATIEDRKRLEINANHLRHAAAELGASSIFWSCEPLLEDLGDITPWLYTVEAHDDYQPGLSWLITGGETDQKLEDGSIHRARPADPDWYRSLRDQCAAAGVPFHFKQHGEWVSEADLAIPVGVYAHITPSCTAVWRAGKDADPCTLDGVVHDARPEIRR